MSSLSLTSRLLRAADLDTFVDLEKQFLQHGFATDRPRQPRLASQPRLTSQHFQLRKHQQQQLHQQPRRPQMLSNSPRRSAPRDHARGLRGRPLRRLQPRRDPSMGAPGHARGRQIRLRRSGGEMLSCGRQQSHQRASGPQDPRVATLDEPAARASPRHHLALGERLHCQFLARQELCSGGWTHSLLHVHSPI